jgi:hypothetical protein
LHCRCGNGLLPNQGGLEAKAQVAIGVTTTVLPRNPIVASSLADQRWLVRLALPCNERVQESISARW